MKDKATQLAHSYVDIHYLPMGDGCSFYRGVLVVWDEDQDPRILGMIDDMPEDVRKNVLAASEHEGVLSLLWANEYDIPDAYADGQMLDVRDGDLHSDSWCINEWKD